MIELTAKQRSELNAKVPRVIDPDTKTTYVLVKDDVYERFEALLVPAGLALSEQQVALQAAGQRAGWDDPEMDVYDREESEQRP